MIASTRFGWWDVLAAFGSLGIAFGASITPAVMFWIAGIPLAFTSALVLSVALLNGATGQSRSTAPLTPSPKWAGYIGTVLLIGGPLMLAVGALMVTLREPVVLDAETVRRCAAAWLLAPALTALGFGLRNPERIKRAVVLFFLLLYVVPFGWAMWRLLHAMDLLPQSA